MAKHRKYLCLAVTTLLLTIVILACAFQMEPEAEAPFFLQISPDGEICLWEDENGVYYAFLPGYADFSEVKIRLNTSVPIYVDGKAMTDGMSCEIFRPDEAYDLTYRAWGREQRDTVVFMQSANAAAMYIDTESGSMEYIHGKKGNEESGTISLYTSDGRLDYAGELSLNGRGNNTWEMYDKKAYSVKLAEEADLLGLGRARKWILLANANDASHMRNKIAYDFAGDIGLAYSPDSQWVDVYLNDEYAGLYLLCERNELHTERIDIGQADGFVVSLEKVDRLVQQNYAHVVTDEKQALRIHDPQSPADETLAEIAAIFQSAENAILAEDGIDPESGKSWTDLIDLDSWVKKYLVEELFTSVDACFISQYFYYDGGADGRIYAGPVWDFDHALGTRKAWAVAAPNTFYANRLHVRSDGFDSPWFHCLYQKEAFYAQMLAEYETVFLPAVEMLLNTHIREYVRQIESAVSMDRIRWSVESDGMDAEVREITAYLEKRIEFLNHVWLEDAAYHMVRVDQGFGAFYGYFAVYSGERLDPLPVLEDTEDSVFKGWYYTATNTPVDFDHPITEDIEIYAKWEDSQSKRMGQAAKLAPLAVIAVMGLALLAVEIKRMRNR